MGFTQQEDARLVAVCIQQWDRLRERIHIGLARRRRFVGNHRHHVRRLLGVQHLRADLDLEEHVEETVRAAHRHKGRQIQYPRILVHPLFDLAQRRPARIQTHHDRPQRTAAHHIQVQHLRRHLIQSVAVCVGRKTSRRINVHLHHRWPGQVYGLGLHAAIGLQQPQGHLRDRGREGVDLHRRIGRVHLAGDINLGVVALFIQQLNALVRQVHIRLARQRRLLHDHGRNVQGRRGVIDLPAHFEQREQVKETVGRACGRERWQVEHPRRVVHLLFNLAHRRTARIQTDNHRTLRTVAHQVQ